MNRKKNRTARLKWKEALEQDEDFLKALVAEVVQQVLEAEMEEALGAAKGVFRYNQSIGFQNEIRPE